MLPSDPSISDTTEALRRAAAQVMEIHDTTFGEDRKFDVRFRGRLTRDSIEAYALVAEKFQALNYTALFRKDGESDAILAVKGVVNPGPSKIWVNYVLFGLTFLSVLVTGGLYGYQGKNPASLSDPGSTSMIKAWS